MFSTGKIQFLSLQILFEQLYTYFVMRVELFLTVLVRGTLTCLQKNLIFDAAVKKLVITVY